MDIPLSKKIDIIKEIISEIDKHMNELDDGVRKNVQGGNWSANDADEQAEVVVLKYKAVKLRLYIEMVEINPIDSEEYKLAIKQINKQIIIHDHKVKHWGNSENKNDN